MLTDHGWHDRVAVARLMQEWPQIVGPDVAAHVEPVGFHEGELTLQADSTAWATQVRLLMPTLRGAIDRQVGDGTVRRVQVLAPKAPSWIAGPRRVKGRGPRDTYG
jgi:predicted nucleic acid-binding Zn ribbon protein